jgi:AmmeMemoRadiSam system protein A
MSPQPENQPARSSLRQDEFTREERTTLLKLAHESILSALEHREISLDPPSPHFSEPCGAFTTIYYQGQLRGCVGYVLAVISLYRTVAETARAAAFEDARFAPVTLAEARALEISLSILSPLRAVQSEEVEIGVHGLVVSYGGRRGLLLPQVPVEHGWNRRTFIEQTCQKAGLPRDAWKNGATLQAFTAEVFGDSIEAAHPGE